MKFNRKKTPSQNPPHKDTLIIVGNGFDIWQGLNTSYSEFQKYYLSHRDEIMKRLRIKNKLIRYDDGETVSISDVELIYGDPFEPDELDSEFWYTFETSLDNIDAERINLFFGKDRKGLREMEKSIRNAKRILREAFCGWIATITVTGKESSHHFGDNCLFVNFNYTDTLQKRFGIHGSDEFHIHGEADDKESIIFGHSSHPYYPEEALYRFGGRFRGLFYIEKILYETDKHADDNIRWLSLFLGMRGMRPECIKRVYVVGHSMSPADIDYFEFLSHATRVLDTSAGEDDPHIPADDIDTLDALNMRLQYAINKNGYLFTEDQITPEQESAVEEKYRFENGEKSREFDREVARMFGKSRKRGKNSAEEEPNIAPRNEDAEWHISYYSERDRIWIEHLMKAMGHTKFRLYPSIDECLQPFKNQS